MQGVRKAKQSEQYGNQCQASSSHPFLPLGPGPVLEGELLITVPFQEKKAADHPQLLTAGWWFFNELYAHWEHSGPGRHWAKACGLRYSWGLPTTWTCRGLSPSLRQVEAATWGKVAAALLVSELVQLFPPGVPPALCKCTISCWHGTPFRKQVRVPSPGQRKEVSLGMGWQKTEHWGDGPSAHLLTGRSCLGAHVQ